MANTSSDVYYEIGAGGGGDTFAACVYGLSRIGEKCITLGAGYSKEEYVRSIIKGMPGARLPYNGDEKLITDYMFSVFDKISSLQCEVYKLNPKENMIKLRNQLFNSLRLNELAIEEQNASFKYMSLIEECLISHFGSLESDINVNMFYSVRNYDDHEIKKMYDGLVEQLKKNPTAIVHIMDFGADIFDFKKLSRDNIVLILILHMVKNVPELKDITVEVEVFGPGVDAHTTLTQACKSIEDYKETLKGTLVDKDEDGRTQKFIGLLNKHKTIIEDVKITTPGRATGNWLYTTKSEADIGTFIDSYLKKRPDYSALKGKAKEIFDADCEEFKKEGANALKKLSGIYRFNFTEGNGNINKLFDIIKNSEIKLDFNTIKI